MAETDLHRDEMAELIAMLKERYALRADVYVAGNLLVYYEEGVVSSRFAPDVFVVIGVPGHQRRTYKMWEEGKAPDVVIEVTSRGSRLEDSGNKKELCALLGVGEYFLYDPEGEYLVPALKGFTLWGSEYRAMSPLPGGGLLSKALGLELVLDSGRIQLVDAGSGKRLPRRPELAASERAARAEAEEARAEAEKARARAERAEAELEALRRRLDRG